MKFLVSTQKFKYVALLTATIWLVQVSILLLEIPYKGLWVGVSGGVLVTCLLLMLFQLLRQQGELQKSLTQLANGQPPLSSADHQAIGQQMIDKVYDKMEEATVFINALEKEEDTTKLMHLSAEEYLGQALVSARTAFTNYRQQEKQHRWVAEGLAHFSEILREYTEDLPELSYQVIQNLSKYLNANQGGLFILNEEEEDKEPFLELQAYYAYQKKRYVEKKVELGHGLIGQCALERKPIILTKVPPDYVTITSGLGEATPRAVVIYPLVFQERVRGVVELASFKPFEEHQLDFLGKVCESMASTLTIVRGSVRTQQMLESSQKLAEELQGREEMMRDYLEELYSAQQRMQDKQAELEGIFKAMDATLLVGYFYLDGRLMTANQNFTELLGIHSEDLEYRRGILAKAERENPELWKELASGASLADDFLLKMGDQEEKWINASLSPVRSPSGEIEKILLLGTDITKKKLVLEKLSLVADNTDNSVIIANKYGQIEYVNGGFTKLTGYQADEVMWLRPGEVLQGPNTDQKTVKRIGKLLRRGVPFYEEILNYTKQGKSYWISLMINPVKNKAGEVERFISIQADVTKIKEATLDYTYKLEAISKSNAVVEFDPQGKILKANDMFLKVSGFTKKDIKGQSYEFLVPDDEKGKPQVQMMWDNLKEGTFFSGEFRLKGQDGQELWLNGTYNPIFNLEGDLHRIVMFAQFTTHEKEKQQELDSTVKALNSAVLTLEMNNQGKLKKANQRFLDAFGYKRLAISRKHLKDLLAPQCSLPSLDNIHEHSTHNLTLLTQNGEEKHFQGRFIGINNLADKQTKIILVLLETPVIAN
ncbi:PAS domain-containing protein [Tunicatimonas pelagia]|uniref:PAS domain-containing protein n=1 Tax=Tunicatimonas pelagia TaxID=931531 RepID=UPI00266572A9|nr:PAS domain-containing protein [Tunicatimonas pelagia]WKN41385.1 PAS domain S-box protein [Tunicatimonas pelagia]